MGDLIARNFKKQTTRAKEKLLESLGKADRTTDEGFDEQLANFNRQQAAADKLAKQLRHYASCARTLGQAAHGVNEALREVYEAHWPEREHVAAMTQSIDLLYEDYAEKLNEHVVQPAVQYNACFTELKTKIEKRGRKLLDYDSARHALLACRAPQGKKGDEHKIARTTEQLTHAQNLYGQINAELLDQLPELFDNRVKFYSDNFSALFDITSSFHVDCSKIEHELALLLEQLSTHAVQLRVARPQIADLPPPPPPPAYVKPTGSDGVNGPSGETDVGEEKKPSGDGDQPKENGVDVGDEKSNSVYPTLTSSPTSSSNKPQAATTPTKSPTTPSKPIPESKAATDGANPFGSGSDGTGSPPASPPVTTTVQVPIPDTVKVWDCPQQMNSNEATAQLSVKAGTSDADDKKEGDEDKEKAESDKPGATARGTAVKPHEAGAAATQAKGEPTILFKVRATHKYTAEDSDELSFEAGELIAVVPYDDPDEQDEGWLMGVVLATGHRGVFPQNFTKPV